MGMPKGYTEGPDKDSREQLIGNAFHTGVLQRVLEDLPWEMGRAGVAEGIGLVVAGQDLGSARMAVYKVLQDLRESGRPTLPLVWGLEHSPPRGHNQAKRLLTKGRLQPREVLGGGRLAQGGPFSGSAGPPAGLAQELPPAMGMGRGWRTGLEFGPLEVPTGHKGSHLRVPGLQGAS